MTECLTPEIISRYRQGSLEPMEAWVSAEAHLAHCAACRTALHAALSEFTVPAAQKMAPTPGEPACLEDALLWRYLDGKADAADAEIVESHVRDCRWCAADLSALRAFQAQMQAYDWRSAHAAARLPSLWSRLRDRFAASPSRRLAWQLCGAAGIACLAGLLVYGTMARPLRAESARLASQLESLRQQHRETQQKLAQLSALEGRLARLQQQNLESQAALKQTRLALAALKRTPPVPAAAQPKVLVALHDRSGPVVLDSQGRLSGLNGLSSATQEAIMDALKSQSVRASLSLKELRGGGEVLLGTPGQSRFALLAPVGKAILSRRPTFRWEAAPRAARYAITVIEESTEREAVQETIPAAEAGKEVAWTLPDASSALLPGRSYRWFVVATMADGSEIKSPGIAAPRARFRVLDAASLPGWKEAQASGSRLALGVFYARHGLLDAAEQKFRALLAANPQSAAAQKLLQSVRKLNR